MPNYQRLSFGHRGGAHKHGNLSNPQLHPQGMRQCPPEGLPECQGQVRDTITGSVTSSVTGGSPT